MTPLAASGDRKHRPCEPDTIWVANRDRGTVMVFDADTGDAVTPTPIVVGPGVHDIAVSHRTGKVFVSDDSSKVFVLAAATREVIDTIEFDPGSRPHHLSASHDQRTVYVGLFAGNNVAAIDTRTHDVRTFPSSTRTGTTAHAPEPSVNDRFVFVPHEGQNLVTMLSARKGTELGAAVVGTAANSSPSEVLSTRDGDTLFVSMRNEGVIRTIDIETFTATGDFVAVGVQPETLILSPGEHMLIVSLRGTPARLAFVDTATLTLSVTLDIAGAGTMGDLAVASPDGRYVYATFDATQTGQGGVAKVDAFRRTLVDTFPYPDLGRPHGIAYVRGRIQHR
jgi:DNA-binding beta-propeller fold protein YncE